MGKSNEPNHLYVFGVQRINVEEEKGNGKCIWCNQDNKKNVAHILSKRIINSNHPGNTLKYSVCEKCNSYFGNKIEDWFYKYSPIGTWTQRLFKEKDSHLKNLRYVPNFIYYDKLKEWIVVNHDYVEDLLGTQILVNEIGESLLFHYDKTGKQGSIELFKIEALFKEKVDSNEFSEYITEVLPKDFSPRLFLYKEKVILIARNSNDKIRLLEKISKVDSNQNHQLIIGDPSAMSNMIIHYYWSLKRYNVLCAKIGFEFLCELKGQDFGQHKRFDTFKKDILSGKTFDKIITPYVDGKGYQVNRLTAPGWISYVNYKKDISGFPVLSSQKPNCHKIFIYSVNGYLLFNICLFEVEPCQLIIAKNCDLEEIFYIEYDFKENDLRFYQLVKNRAKFSKPEEYKKVISEINEDQDLRMITFYDLDPSSLFKNE